MNSNIPTAARTAMEKIDELIRIAGSCPLPNDDTRETFMRRTLWRATLTYDELLAIKMTLAASSIKNIP